MVSGGMAVAVPGAAVEQLLAEADALAGRGFLGLTGRLVAVEAADSAAAALLVSEVDPEGPADAAGLVLGDVIIAVGGGVSPEPVDRQLRRLRVGEAVQVEVLRGGEPRRFSAIPRAAWFVSGSQGAIRVLVVADEPSVRADLQAMLEAEGLQVAGAVPSTGSEGAALPSTDVVVIRVTGGIGAGGAIEAFSHLPTVFLLEPGATPGPTPREGKPYAFLRSDADGAELAAAVQSVANGLIVTDPRLAGRGASTATLSAAMAEPLTGREREVLALVAAGLPNKAIALQLGISEHTAKFHVSQILSKLDAGSRTEAVTRAATQGLLVL